MWKAITDNLALLVVLWGAIPLAFLAGGVILDGASGTALILGLLGLYVGIVVALMWLWSRLRGSSGQKTGAPGDD